MSGRALQPVDPFELPEWLGTDEVTWAARCDLTETLVSGALNSETSGATLDCDVLAADVAAPQPVVEEPTRVAVHQAWRLGQVQLLGDLEHLVLATPTTAHTADDLLEVLGRLADAVGAPRRRFALRLPVGR